VDLTHLTAKPVNPKHYSNPWHPDDPVVFSQTTRAWKLDFPWDKVPAETAILLERSRLSMKCPYCGQKEPAGPWCSQCGRMVTHEHWFKGEAIDSPPAPGKRRRGRPSKKDMEEAGKVCECSEKK
jgi:endogenous inhibitor of DNA gyrase (YacG/DUF329 family)